GFAAAGWPKALGDDIAGEPKKRRTSCILLWMDGGPSQIDTFDLKPGHANGGPFKEIDTAAEGIKISEHLPKIAKFMDKMAIIRSMDSKENNHPPGTYLMLSGRIQRGPIQYPTLGSLVSKELGSDDAGLPNFVSIATSRVMGGDAFGSGFLGPKFAPLIVGEFNYQQNNNEYEKLLKVQDLAPPAGVGEKQLDARVELLQDLQKDFIDKRPGIAPKSHQTAYQ